MPPHQNTLLFIYSVQFHHADARGGLPCARAQVHHAIAARSRMRPGRTCVRLSLVNLLKLTFLNVCNLTVLSTPIVRRRPQ